ncbi:l-ascorbate oxidase [Moniliophthora roreri]|uniref:Peroxidase n=1 Tax=Moniliophthora roreri TaxID=221103 RepID=A0A0W0FS63_MONRR|nr:l-ascorbate oxidase [Moniliophthora roreri]
MRYFSVPWLLTGSAVVAQGKMFHWPSPQMDWIDSVLYELPFLENTTLNCAERDNTTVGAQWLRIAFHDSATHNVEDGTGGADASIIYELDRAENVGVGMNRSIGDFVGFGTPFFGMADIIAMGAVLGVASCDGPTIPYRAGRVDASGPGPLGVPQPQEVLATHIEQFRLAGFNQSEMIALTACGPHAFGGVTKSDFPDIVKHERDFVFFNNQTTKFDEGVVTQFLDGTTPNLLVVGPNMTTNSDERIFGSDGNVTMQSLSSRDTFMQICSTLIERMINTVPDSVTLTDVIDPFDYKVGKARLSVSKDTGNLVLGTTLRLLNPTENPNRQVRIVWLDRQGYSCPPAGCSAPHTNVSSIGTTFLQKSHGTTALQYEWTVEINAATSISKFWFEVDEQDGSKPTLVKNDDGEGYPIDQDDVLYDVIRSQLFFDSNQIPMGSDIVIAVRDAEVSNAKITLKAFNPFVVPFQTSVVEVPLDPRHPPTAGYTFYAANLTGFFQNSFDVFNGDVEKQTFALAFEAKNVIFQPPS